MDRIVNQRTSYADSLTFEKIPSPVIHQAKRLVNDAPDCAMEGADSLPSRITRTVAMETTGRWRTTVLARGQKALTDLERVKNLAKFVDMFALSKFEAKGRI